ncbi:hypothetical protein R1flu_028842 [Riccia fluitans]|uniref:Uncharacterized protein n=1 Tax=Riccia fluitans TaxID=41844 RepID=A0ABD1XMU9_9MARC
MIGGSHSPNLGLLDQEASMQNIDRLVEALEMEARESRMSKCKKLFSDEPFNSTLQVYQPLDQEKPSSSAVQPTRSNIGTTSKYIMDLSIACLRKLVDFLVKGECRRIVPPSQIEAEFLNEGWVVDDFKKFSLECHPNGYALDKQVGLAINQVQRMVDPRSLGHDRNDKFSGGKFREGWQAIVRLVRADFLAKQATTRHEPLLLEAHNAFTNTRAEWDNEKGELVREREALKEELNKAKEMAAKSKEMAVEAE